MCIINGINSIMCLIVLGHMCILSASPSIRDVTGGSADHCSRTPARPAGLDSLETTFNQTILLEHVSHYR